MRILTLLALTAVLATNACVLNLGGTTAVGTVRVQWSFDGERRCAVIGAGIITAQLIATGNDAAGNPRTDTVGGAAQCLSGALVIQNVPAGTYSLSMDSGVGSTRFEAIQNITVVANRVNEIGIVTLDATRGGPASFHVGWSFGGETDCTTALVDSVLTQVFDKDNNLAGTTVTNCLAGSTTVGALPIGDYRLVMTGNLQGVARFTVTRNITLGVGQGDLGVLDLAAKNGTVKVTWLVLDGTDITSCQDAGIQTAVIVRAIKDGATVAAATPNCETGTTTFNNLAPGAYTFSIQGTGTNNRRYAATTNATINPGQNPDQQLQVGETKGRVKITWSFQDGDQTFTDCTTARSDTVTVLVKQNGQLVPAGGNVNCLLGTTTLENLPAGESIISITAGVQGQVRFKLDVPVTIIAGPNPDIEATLAAAIAEVKLTWQYQLANGTLTRDCLLAGVGNMIVQIFDENGVPAVQGFGVQCLQGSVQLPAIAPGDYRMTIDAAVGNNAFGFSTPIGDDPNLRGALETFAAGTSTLDIILTKP
jgi:hypothetical protein